MREWKSSMRCIRRERSRSFITKTRRLLNTSWTLARDGGARVIEFTNRGDFAWQVFSDLNRYCEAQHPEVILGVGSVIDAPTAALYISCGANFVVGPLLNPEVARLCNRRKIAYSPGCGSVSEISAAEELGVEIVKGFRERKSAGPLSSSRSSVPCPGHGLCPQEASNQPKPRSRAGSRPEPPAWGWVPISSPKLWLKRRTGKDINGQVAGCLRLVESVRKDILDKAGPVAGKVSRFYRKNIREASSWMVVPSGGHGWLN